MEVKIRVIEKKEAPHGIGFEMQQGITSKESAMKWAIKHGYSVVFYVAKKQRVYADRLQARIDHQASKIEQDSAELVKIAEGSL